jgi:oligopeptide/dipeptide ABC transporter ATP-binding protein
VTGTQLVEVRDLRVRVPAAPDGTLPIIHGISFDIRAGRVLGVVGESGSGKSTVADALLRLNPAGTQLSGRIRFAGGDLLRLGERELRAIRGARISLIGQDPLDSLNPLHRVGDQISEVLLIHRKADHAGARIRALELMRQCDLPDPELTYRKYPHELSGGMRQRIAIAIAIAAEPTVIVADEPTTSLDNSVQRQILDLLRALCVDRGVALVLITHDLGVVHDVADDIVVLYAGSIVEMGRAADVLADPRHQYTRALLAAQPRVVDGYRASLLPIPGAAPRPGDLPAGCAFAPRCAYGSAACAEPAAGPDTGTLDTHWHVCRHPGDQSQAGADKLTEQPR